VAAGLPSALAERARLARINVELCRRFWSGEKVSYQDGCYHFQKVALRPLPVKPIPIWCGGSTPAACRRVVEFGEGWLPARITIATFRKRIEYLRELSQTAGRPMARSGIMPLTSIAKDKETALKYVNVKALIQEANRNSTWVKPAAGISRSSTISTVSFSPEHRQISSGKCGHIKSPAPILWSSISASVTAIGINRLIGWEKKSWRRSSCPSHPRNRRPGLRRLRFQATNM
jgi:alkanesulfonate monooxygenase SsuD/methylene tetrahydromethanopterin reductase-like flavin-dependent oxidoreductase (luciferase family)